MSDAQTSTMLPPAASRTDAKILPISVYVLYLLAFVTHGATALIGVVLAYVFKTSAPTTALSHYVFLIRTFWLGLAGFAVLGAVMLVGIPLSFLIIGIPIVVLAGIGMVALAVWYGVRTVVGLIRIANDEPYPAPRSWLL